MGLLDKLLGKKKEEPSQGSGYFQKDDRGTNHDTLDKASAYWFARIGSSKKDPFVVYTFDSEKEARDALLEVPCIHVAQDSGRLICTETLLYGCYPSEGGKFESFVCGDDLTHATWEIAKNSFIKHGGKPKGQGELEPEKPAAPAQPAQATQSGGVTFSVGAAPQIEKADPAGKVTFVREDRQMGQMGRYYTYRIYKGPDAASAKAFLDKNPVFQQLVYIVVETPEGNYCRDIGGMYKE